MPGCGSRTTQGHGDVAVCGQPYYDGIYECDACKIRRLESARFTVDVAMIRQALADQQALEGEVVHCDLDDIVAALRDMGIEVIEP